jgi:flagellar hook assembly protein FlgD
MRGTTEITYSIAVSGPVRLTIYDVNGREVRTLVDQTQGTGAHSILWDGTNDGGGTVARGVYTYRIVAPGIRSSQKIVIR